MLTIRWCDTLPALPPEFQAHGRGGSTKPGRQLGFVERVQPPAARVPAMLPTRCGALA